MECEQEGCTEVATFYANRIPPKGKENRSKAGCSVHIGELMAAVPEANRWMIDYQAEE
jgi:hypothetical protein